MPISQNEFYEIDSLYEFCFGAASVPTETIAQWFEAQPDGLVALKVEGNIIGALSYWYVEEAEYLAMLKGELKEKELSILPINFATNRFVYMSEIALHPEFRGKGYAMKLLELWLNQLHEENLAVSQLTLFALGYSQGGVGILAKLGLNQVKAADETADNMPLYQLEIIKPESIEQLIHRLF